MTGFQLLCVLLLLKAGACTPASRTGPAEERDPCAEQDAHQDNIRRWPGGIIPYVMDDSVTGISFVPKGEICMRYYSDNAKSKLVASMQRCENITCTVFVPWTDQPDYVSFELGERCCSFTGRTGGGMQKVYICNRDNSVDHTIQTLTGVPKQLQSAHPYHGASDRQALDSSNSIQNSHAVEFNDVSRCTDMCGSCIKLNPYTNNEGVLSSPHYPNHYQTNVDCVWKLIAPVGYAITLTFNDFDVEWEKHCAYDYVDVFNVDNNGHTLRHDHLCGSQVPTPISTIGEYGSDTVIIRLHSDESYTGGGFLLRYALEARVEKLNCTINNGGCAQLCLADSQGWKTACDCKEGYSLAKDGHTCADINECKSRKGGCHHRCTNTEGSFQCHCKQGFSLNTDGTTCRECGGYHNATAGVILSPGYPAPYPAFQNCYWNIGVYTDHYLRITISWDITRKEKCEVDYLKVQYGHFPYMRKLCGYLSQVTYYISQSMYVRFHTKDINALHSSGFMLSYTQIPAEEVTFVDLEYVIVDGMYVEYSERRWI